MAGNEIEVTAPVSVHHRWEMLEDYLVELPAGSFGFDTFGCELTFIAEDTLSPPVTPSMKNSETTRDFIRQSELEGADLKRSVC